MSTTLPKSVQADMESRLNPLSIERSRQIREFVHRFKELPNDFLRLQTHNHSSQIDQQQFQDPTLSRATPMVEPSQNIVEMIEISVVEAQLVKNYGLLKMDLYCKIRVGHLVCETQTCPNGAKNPKWDGVYQFNLKPGLDSFHLEIYDERQFSPDEKIAWLYEPIPPEVFQGITVERWFPLSGKLGHHNEGKILLVMSHKRMPARPQAGHRLNPAPLHLFMPPQNQGRILSRQTMIPIESQIPTYVTHLPPPGSSPYIPETGPTSHTQAPATAVSEQRESQPTQQPLVPAPVSDEDINQLNEMFPSISKSVIKSILENHNNDKEAAISYLLSLS